MINFLAFELDPSEVSAMEFTARSVQLPDEDLRMLVEMKQPVQVIENLRRSDLDLTIRLTDDTEMTFQTLASAFFEVESGPIDLLDGTEGIKYHSDTIYAVVSDFNQLAIGAGYPVTLDSKSYPYKGKVICTQGASSGPVHAEDAVDLIYQAIEQSGSEEEGYPTEYLDHYYSLTMILSEAQSACRGVESLSGIMRDKSSRDLYSELCRLSLACVVKAFKGFQAEIPQHETAIHQAVHDSAVRFVEAWLLSDLYFPYEDPRDFLSSIKSSH